MDSSLGPVSAPSGCAVSGFWRRLLAFIIDGVILGLVGIVSGIFFFDFFAHLGGWGRLVGFGVALVYFGALNSTFGGGKTFGKALMGIEVVDALGRHLSLWRSVVRYAILGVPFFLNGAPMPPAVLQSPVMWLVGFLVLGVGGAILYLIVFNRNSRQSVHDLAVGSFVVRSGGGPTVAARTVWRGHLIVVGVWCGTVVPGMIVAGLLFERTALFADLFAVQKAIQATGKVHSATVTIGATWTWRNGVKAKTTFAQAVVVLKERPANTGAVADQIASIILATSREVPGQDVLLVKLAYGYDIGIAHAWLHGGAQRSLGEWSARLRSANNIQTNAQLPESGDPRR